jgi:hypothetical protein
LEIRRVIAIAFKFTLECATRRVQVNQGRPEVKWYRVCFWFMLMMFIYWAESIHTIKKISEALVFASKGTGLEVNADKTKYLVMFRD